MWYVALKPLRRGLIVDFEKKLEIIKAAQLMLSSRSMYSYVDTPDVVIKLCESHLAMRRMLNARR